MIYCGSPERHRVQALEESRETSRPAHTHTQCREGLVGASLMYIVSLKTTWCGILICKLLQLPSQSSYTAEAL
jgi:hypothetical protein